MKTNSWVDEVYQIVRSIPRGRVTTYGTIADAIGAKATSRMVGWAMNKSHFVLPRLPAHRVVNRVGLLTGRHHFETPTLMQELLEAEGIVIKEHQIQNFETHFWRPEQRKKLC